MPTVPEDHQSAIVRGATRSMKIVNALIDCGAAEGHRSKKDKHGTLLVLALTDNGKALQARYEELGVEPEPDVPTPPALADPGAKRRRNTLTERQRQIVVGGRTYDRVLADQIVDLMLADGYDVGIRDAGGSVVYEECTLKMTDDGLALRERYKAVRIEPEPEPKPGDPNIIGSRAIVLPQPMAACVAVGRCNVLAVTPKYADTARRLVGRRVGIIEGKTRTRKLSDRAPDGLPWPSEMAPGCVIGTVRIDGVVSALEPYDNDWRPEGSCVVMVSKPFVLPRPVAYVSGPGWIRLDRRPRSRDKYAEANAQVRRQEAEGLS